MIRPFTLICMVSAFGSGLYLYQSKHQAQVLDREIGRTIKQAETTRDRTGMLRAEWALLNEPDRLAELAKAHTSLQTLKPTQFVAVADLAARLPAPAANNHEKLPAEAEPEDLPAAPVAQAAPPAPAPPPASVAVVPPAKPREVATLPEPKPKAEPKQIAVADVKPAPRHNEKPAMVATAQIASEPTPARARPPRPDADTFGSEATAPGTVGAAVLRAMRSRSAEPAPNETAYVQSAPPQFARPTYIQPTYAQPAYAAPAASVLGTRSALPPPVPFAAR